MFLVADELNDPKLLETFDQTFELQLTNNKMDTRYDDEVSFLITKAQIQCER